MNGALVFGLALSAHLGLTGNYNEVHPFVEYEVNQWSLGAYYNSERNMSPYLTYTWDVGQTYLEIGVVGGYENSTVLPYGRVGYRFDDKVSVFAAPAYEEGGNVGAVAGLEIKF